MLEYQKNELCRDGIPLSGIAAEWGTPAYLYNRSTLEENYLRIKKIFGPLVDTICYAVKANSNPELVSILAGLGAGADIVSMGELFLALKSGIPHDKIVFAGAGKTDEELNFAVKSRLMAIAVESEQELKIIESYAKDMLQKQPVIFRINPDVDPETHPYISTGEKHHKFGIDIAEAKELIEYCRYSHSLHFAGLHVHIGSQLTKTEPVEKSLFLLSGLVDEIEKEGVEISLLDLGGGFPVDYDAESNRLLNRGSKPTGLNIDEIMEYWAAAVRKYFGNRKFRIIIEPGRSVTAECGILLTKILYTKTRGDKNFLIVDAGMNDLIRPALYNARHGIVPLKEPSGERNPYDIGGPVCETADIFARDVLLPACRRGDYLAILTTGAYGYVAASNYNLRPKPPELLLENSSVRCIRPREHINDII